MVEYPKINSLAAAGTAAMNLKKLDRRAGGR